MTGDAFRPDVGSSSDTAIESLAHELRNRLAPLRLGWELMRLAGTDEMRLSHARQLVGDQIERLTALVDSLSGTPLTTTATPTLEATANRGGSLAGGQKAPSGTRAPHPARILVVDDDDAVRSALAEALLAHWQVETAVDGEDALEHVGRQPPDLVLTDVVMPKLDGLGLLRALRNDTRTHAIPIIILSARGAVEEARVEGLVAGADDYLPKSLGVSELLARVTAHLDIARLRAEAVEAARRDPLTGLLNRTQAHELAESVFARARRRGTHSAVLVIDLDRFKSINDTYGHAAGDDVLCEVARRLKTSLRGEDIVARLGGDEFVAVLAETRSTDDVVRVAHHIVQRLQDDMMIAGTRLSISGSIGIGLFPADGADFISVMRQADGAMYRAKQTGHRVGLAPKTLDVPSRPPLAVEQRRGSAVPRSGH